MSDRARINEFTPATDIQPGDVGYSLRGSQDLSRDDYTAIRALIGIAVGKTFKFDGTTGTRVELDGLNAGILKGLDMTWVSTTSLSVAAGFIADSTNSDLLALRSALTKTTSAWAAGTAAGGIDTGVIAANTLYAWYLIKNPTTGAIDVTFSTNLTTPSLASGWTLYRRIFFARTDGSSQWVKMFQKGRQFHYDSKVTNLNAGTPASANRILVTTVNPPGTEGILAIELLQTGATTTYLDAGWTSLADAAAAITNAILSTVAAATRVRSVFRIQIDASRQFYYRVSTATGVSVTILELGWIDNLVP